MKLLIQFWLKASADLGILIEAPFALTLSDGTVLSIDVLVKGFGSKNGMLVVSDYNLIKNYTDQISNQGYGYSVMSDYSAGSSYDKENFVGVLADWGWSGNPADAPEWLLTSSPA